MPITGVCHTNGVPEFLFEREDVVFFATDDFETSKDAYIRCPLRYRVAVSLICYVHFDVSP